MMFHPSLVSTDQQVNGYRNWRAFFGPPCPPPWKTNGAKKVARSWNNKRHLQKSHRHYRHCTLASIITDLWFVHSTEYTQWVFPWLRQPRRAVVFFDLFAPSMIRAYFAWLCNYQASISVGVFWGFRGMRILSFLALEAMRETLFCTGLRTSELTFPNDINDRIELQLAPGLSCLFIPAFSAFGAFLLTSLLSLKRRQFHHVLQNRQSKNFVQFAKRLCFHVLFSFSFFSLCAFSLLKILPNVMAHSACMQHDPCMLHSSAFFFFASRRAL